MKMRSILRRRLWALILTGTMTLSLIPVQAFAAEGTESPIETFDTLLSDMGSLQISSVSDKDGGCAEIVKYNPDNRRYYVVDGKDEQLTIVDLSELKDSAADNTDIEKEKEINFEDITENIPDFTVGDLTSVAIDTNRDLVAVAVQEEDYRKDGAVVLLDYEGNFIKSFPTGVQPDMVCFSPDSNYLLTADEGEPREGYDAGKIDPKGSVTVVDLSRGLTEATGKTVTFGSFDDKRDQLIQDGVILKKDTAPSADLEPEYIAVAGGKAYVTCQEANAIATLDIKTARFTGIKGLGFQDYSKVPVDVLKSDDKTIANSAELELEPTLRGIYMPDGITAYQDGGKTYLLTANEGDSRDWPDYSNEKTVSYKDGYKKLTCLDTSDYDGNFEAQNSYLFGGRSFSVWDADTMELVFDSGSDFEAVTAEAYPDHFNCSNDDVDLDSRSNKKGPEPEYVTIGSVDGTPYAFIGLERIGGVIAYDISNIEAPAPVDYLNTRDFSSDIAGDDSPEGLDFVPAEDSANEYPLLLVGNEVSGTVSIMKVGDTQNTDERTVTIFHTNDMHGSLVTTQSNGVTQKAGADLVAALKKSVPGSLLIDAGDATQGSSFATLTQGKDVIRLMNAAGYDAMAAGNHEFDYGQLQMLKNAQAAEFPMLAANVLKNGKPLLQGEEYCGGSITNNGQYQIEYAEGLKIGIFGITTPETAFKTNPTGTQGIDFGANDVDAIAETTQAQIDQLRNMEKCDIVIGAMHIGDDPSSVVTAEGIAPKIHGLDLLIDGHSHQEEQINNVDGDDGTPIPIVQTGTASAKVGKVEISWDDTDGSVDQVTTELLTAKEVGETCVAEPSITEMAVEMASAQTEQLKPVVGKTGTTLWGGTINSINEARIAETNMGSLVADSMARKATQLITEDGYKNLPVVALQNGGGVRAVIKAGNVTIGDVLNVLPFGNTLAFKEVTPAVLYKALENGVAGVTGQDAATGKISGAAGGFPQISGFKFTYDPRLASGSRVTSVTLSNGTALRRDDTDTKLVLASNDFELAGGDGYTMLVGLPSVGEGGTLDTVLDDYIKSKGTVNIPITSGRIICDGGYEPKPYGATVAVRKAGVTVASMAVDYRVDGGKIMSVTTDADGNAMLAGLTDGPHAIKIGDADDVLVNNYSGAGVSTSVAANVNTTVKISNNTGPHGSGSKSSSSSGNTAPSVPGTVTTATNAAGVTVAAVTTQADTAPVITGNHAAVTVTVPADVASIIASANAEKPVEVKIAAPTSTLVQQLQNSAVNTVDLTMQIPSAAVNNANANVKVSVNVEPAVLQAAKDAQKDITLGVTDAQTGAVAYSWTFSGAGLRSSAASVTNVDLAVTVQPVQSDAAASAVAAGNTADKKPAGFLLKFGNNGLLPATASVRVYVGNQAGVTPNSRLYLYYFNSVTNALEQLPQSEYTVDANGYVTFSITHCSNYVVLPQAATNPYPVRSDTTYPVGLKNGKTYTYSFTVSGNVIPSFTVGNEKVATSSLKRQNGKCLFTVKAVGTPGQMTAVYSTLPGQKGTIMGYIAVTK